MKVTLLPCCVPSLKGGMQVNKCASHLHMHLTVRYDYNTQTLWNIVLHFTVLPLRDEKTKGAYGNGLIVHCGVD